MLGRLLKDGDVRRLPESLSMVEPRTGKFLQEILPYDGMVDGGVVWQMLVLAKRSQVDALKSFVVLVLVKKEAPCDGRSCMTLIGWQTDLDKGAGKEVLANYFLSFRRDREIPGGWERCTIM